VGRYIKKFSRVGHALGPSEERGFELWAGLTGVDGWKDDALAQYGITSFTVVGPADVGMYEKLGIARKPPS
jgi:hypothetical protein